ncbi:DUF3891 family protein [Desmospora activa]|uniref:Uncharacterized protein DUF3891 n=1 Tax=Desmospora activa DSM 45169 TaxID=1121389 RepID=A0A2T4ZDA7_9BACL|nr:DUF3891 family protein [Desmospora activa]PTM59873.1 uncharacterized protein DUF3891 [Desmospora activa DSM 45169]
MILRKIEDGLDLIRQHDHGWVSGDFAEHWKERPSSSVLFAIRYHDVGWESLDQTITWNPKTGQPYTFEDYPMQAKIDAYQSGVGWVQARDPYAACLCSRHYTSFFINASGEAERRFLAEEQKRQERLKRQLDEETRSRLASDWALLKLCDDLSLFLCLNPPGENRHPWYQEGFHFQGKRLNPSWEGRDTLFIEPNPFASSFTVRIPYERLTEAGQPVTVGTNVITIQSGTSV